jgi:hypothetical protein
MRAVLKRRLVWIDGLLSLPVGSRINLDDVPGGQHVRLDRKRFPTGHADAIVVGHRLWGTQRPGGGILVLLVELTPPGGQGDRMLDR